MERTKTKKTESEPGHSALKDSVKTNIPRSQQDVHRNKQEEHQDDQKGQGVKVLAMMMAASFEAG